MAIVKVQNVTQQFAAVRDLEGNIVQGQKISIPTQSAKLADLLLIDENTEYLFIDFFGDVWLRLDGQPASEKNGHKFTSNDHPIFSISAAKNIVLVSAGSSAVEAFISQIGGGC